MLPRWIEGGLYICYGSYGNEKSALHGVLGNNDGFYCMVLFLLGEVVSIEGLPCW